VVAEGLLGELERFAGTVCLTDLDPVAGPGLERRHVGGPSVDCEVAVRDELASLGAGAGEAHPVDHVVQPELQRPKQVLAGHAGPALGNHEVVAELALEHAVRAANLLLLTQLHAVLANLATADAVLTGRGGPPLERALLGVAARALEEELGALPPAEAANGVGVTGHGSSGL
jgi:hypothetical protein